MQTAATKVGKKGSNRHLKFIVLLDFARHKGRIGFKKMPVQFLVHPKAGTRGLKSFMKTENLLSQRR